MAKETWSPLAAFLNLDILRMIETDPDRNPALGRAFKEFGLDPERAGDWLVLCALLAKERFAERGPGQPEKWGKEQQHQLIQDQRKEFGGRYRDIESETIRRRLHTVLKADPWRAKTHVALFTRKSPR